MCASVCASPSVIQVEAHPYYPQTALRECCHGRGIAVTAYSSLGEGRPELLSHRTVLAIADTHTHSDGSGVSPAQVLLRWGLQAGMGVIPKSGSPTRIAENARLFDFELSSDDMAALGAMAPSPTKFCWDPSTVK